ncbi:amidase family protein [Sporosarcina trichiuri]|uniref:amidase family protein n=1 Tax=Sporosarcina trichiuri TaxID=3056445 RepID=UPI0025B40F99|nr:amidase family protein [Sporosarcina sp. 0.2-SM1T-5]WJY27634.1 amidase family protein [Sporosarcina sp. 0.2-SM1T-5]
MNSSTSIRDKFRWVIDTDILTLQQAMEDGRLTAEQLVLFYLDRIATVGQETDAVLEVNPHALQIAQMLDGERQQTGRRSMLHGIPILLKDNMDTGDAMHTSAGSLALADYYAPRDSFLAAKLREAGAVLLGKTNMTEWANFLSEDMPNGYSSRGGQVKNPYGPFEVGGSSSGSAVAASASLAAACMGTETTGSIIHPAAQNGIVGLKPTVGAISRRGIIPLSVSQDTPGPMARTVSDAAIVFQALLGEDPEDPVTATCPFRAADDWLGFLSEDSLAGVRVGVARSIFAREVSDERMGLFESALAVLEQAGAIIRTIDLGTKEDDLWYDVLLHECKAALNAYLGRTPAVNPIRSVDDIIRYNEEHPADTLAYGQELLKDINNRSGRLTEPAYIEALIRNRHLAENVALGKAMEENGVDVLVFPQDHGCSFEAAAGYPSVTVPAGVTAEGEPFGLTFTGEAFSEPDLIGYAYAFEQLTQARQTPSIV